MKIGDKAYYYNIDQGSKHCYVWVRKCNIISFDDSNASVLTQGWFRESVKIKSIKDLYESPEAVIEFILNHFKKYPPTPSFRLEFKQ